MKYLIFLLLFVAGCGKDEPVNCYVCTLRQGTEVNICDVSEEQLYILVKEQINTCVKYKWKH